MRSFCTKVAELERTHCRLLNCLTLKMAGSRRSAGKIRAESVIEPAFTLCINIFGLMYTVSVYVRSKTIESSNSITYDERKAAMTDFARIFPTSPQSRLPCLQTHPKPEA